jgi:uncharacterized protein (TIGR00725 family)
MLRKIDRDSQVFGSSRPKPGDAAFARAEAAGAAIAAAGFELYNGGYLGTMEASAKGAVEAGGKATGVLVPHLFPHRDPKGNEFNTDAIDTATLLERINAMTEGVRYFIVLPGTVGTLTELTVAWNIAALGELGDYEATRIFCYREPWETVMSAVVDGLGISKGHADLITYVEDAAEAMELIKVDFDERNTAIE